MYFVLHYSASGIVAAIVEPLVGLTGAAGLYYVLGSLSLAACLFVTFCFKETMGLTDKEKKELYYPKELVE